MARPEDFDSPEREAQLAAMPGVSLAPGSSEPFVGRDEAALLADASLERLNSIPVGPPEIILED